MTNDSSEATPSFSPASSSTPQTTAGKLQEATSTALSKPIALAPGDKKHAVIAALLTALSVASFPIAGYTGANALPGFNSMPSWTKDLVRAYASISATTSNFGVNYKFFIPFSRKVVNAKKGGPDERGEQQFNLIALGGSLSSTIPFLGLTHVTWYKILFEQLSEKINKHVLDGAGVYAAGSIYGLLMLGALSTFTALHYEGAETLIKKGGQLYQSTKLFFTGKSAAIKKQDCIERLREANVMLFKNGFKNLLKKLKANPDDESLKQLKTLLNKTKLTETENNELTQIVYQHIDNDNKKFHLTNNTDWWAAFSLKVILFATVVVAILGYEQSVEQLLEDVFSFTSKIEKTVTANSLMIAFYGILALVSDKTGQAIYDNISQYFHKYSPIDAIKHMSANSLGALKSRETLTAVIYALFTYGSSATPLGLAAKLSFFTYIQPQIIGGTMLFNMFPGNDLSKQAWLMTDRLSKKADDINFQHQFKLMNFGAAMESMLGDKNSIGSDEFYLFLQEKNLSIDSESGPQSKLDLIKAHFESANLFPNIGSHQPIECFISNQEADQTWGAWATEKYESTSSAVSGCVGSFSGCWAGLFGSDETVSATENENQSLLNDGPEAARYNSSSIKHD